MPWHLWKESETLNFALQQHDQYAEPELIAKLDASGIFVTLVSKKNENERKGTGALHTKASDQKNVKEFHCGNISKTQ